MDDYSALAQRTAVSVPEVRGCIILSRDGLVLGAYPDHDEAPAKSAWLRFCALGEPERSFIEFTDQTWAFVKRGPYAAFAVAEPGCRPGILVDQLEQVLFVAEESRSKRDALRVPEAPSAPSGKPRTSLHPSADRPAPVEVGNDRRGWSSSTPGITGATPGTAKATPGTASAGSARATDPLRAPIGDIAPPPASPAAPIGAEVPPPAPAPASTDPATADPAAATGLRREPQRLVGGDGEAGNRDDDAEDDSEVDRVLLAKEFSGLLQMDAGDDEGSS